MSDEDTTADEDTTSTGDTTEAVAEVSTVIAPGCAVPGQVCPSVSQNS